jgi:hypothetical protein
MLIPIKKRETERPEKDFRWAIDISFSSLALTNVVRGDEEKNLWRPVGRYFGIYINRHWSWGSEHIYYDGPNCSFSIGFLHIAWSWNFCQKCFEEA